MGFAFLLFSAATAKCQGMNLAAVASLCVFFNVHAGSIMARITSRIFSLDTFKIFTHTEREMHFSVCSTSRPNEALKTKR